MLSNRDAVVQAVERGGEIGVADLAAKLRLDKGTVRKCALEAARKGRIGTRNNGQGYVFFPMSRSAGGRSVVALGPPIDATFREVSSAAPASRAVVPTGAAQNFDNRLEAQLARNRRGVRSSPTQTGFGVTDAFSAILSDAFVSVVEDDEVLGALASAWRENAAVVRAAEDRAAREHAAADHRRRADAKAAEDARRTEQERKERAAVFAAVTAGLWPREAPVSGSSTCVLDSENGQSVDQKPSERGLILEKPTPKSRQVSGRPDSRRVAEFFAGARPATRQSFWRKHFAATSKTVWR